MAVPVIELVDRSINYMRSKKLVDVTLEGQVEVTKLGRATLKGIVDLDRANQLFQDLRQAQSGLVLHSKLHLMYLVTPYDMVGIVNPIAATYFQVIVIKFFLRRLGDLWTRFHLHWAYSLSTNCLRKKWA